MSLGSTSAPTYYQITSMPGVNFVIKDDYDALKARVAHLEEGYRLIMKSDCCPDGSRTHGNGCPKFIAEEALDHLRSIEGLPENLKKIDGGIDDVRRT